jgi:Transposase DDE domain
VTTKNKQQYRIRNWCDYNKALISRGSLTLWLDVRSLDTWLDADQPARRGRRRTYSDVAILCSLIVREVYHLPLRAAQGMLRSLMQLLRLSLPAPHYSTLSRRACSLNLSLAPGKQIRHLVIDSTGLKLYGEGEWRVKMRKWTKHRTWRKLHIALDAATHQRGLPRLLRQIDVPVEQVLADGAYDSRECYRVIDELGARPIIPPRKGSVFWSEEYLRQRNRNLREVRKRGQASWKKKAGYHRRSLVETAIFRLKALFTDKLRSRERERQRTEVMVRCHALNRMTSLGMPHSYAV